MDREKLKEKLRKKRQEKRKNGGNLPPNDIFNGETDIMKMMENVNKILKTNPQMVQQISKCVSNVMGNKELMNSLAGQLENQINIQDQTLESKSPAGNCDASLNESKQ
jgi:hypothetical protein